MVAVALLILFEGVNRLLSTLTAWFRVAYAAVFLVAICQLLVALPLLDENPAAAMGAIDAFDTIWHVSLVLFAVHLLLLGYVAYRSGFVPRILGVLLVIAGLGYLADSVAGVLVANSTVDIARFTFVGEVALIIWLLVRGHRVTTA